jgi:hypothetical protein
MDLLRVSQANTAAMEAMGKTTPDNQLVEEFCGTKSNVQFLDVSTAMLDSRGKSRRDRFKWDDLHPSGELCPVDIHHPPGSDGAVRDPRAIWARHFKSPLRFLVVTTYLCYFSPRQNAKR